MESCTKSKRWIAGRGQTLAINRQFQDFFSNFILTLFERSVGVNQYTSSKKANKRKNLPIVKPIYKELTLAAIMLGIVLGLALMVSFAASKRVTETKSSGLALQKLIKIALFLSTLCVFSRDYLGTVLPSIPRNFFLAAHPYFNNRDTVLNVLDFGALGDNQTDDTEALRRAIKFASHLTNGGGAAARVTLWIPENHTFCTGPLNLTSGVTLKVDGILRALLWTETDWPQIPPLENYGNSRDGFYLQYQAFLYARNVRDIKVVGKGVVDGQGQFWWDADQNRSLTVGRPNLVQFVRSQNIEIQGVTLKDSPFWCLHPVLCRDVHIHHIKIRSHMYAHNSDGIDPDSSKNVLIEDNDVSCGDDHIAIKAGVCGEHNGSPLDCEATKEFTDGTYETVNVTIRRNIFRTGMGIALGSELSGGIRDVRVEDNLVGLCMHGHCDVGCCGWGPALHIKTTNTRGGHVENVLFRNNTIYNNTFAISVTNEYQTDNHVNGRPTRIQNLSFESNREGGMAKSISLSCSKDLPCQNVTFRNNDFDPSVPIQCKNVEVIDQNGNNVCSSIAKKDSYYLYAHNSDSYNNSAPRRLKSNKKTKKKEFKHGKQNKKKEKKSNLQSNVPPPLCDASPYCYGYNCCYPPP